MDGLTDNVRFAIACARPANGDSSGPVTLNGALEERLARLARRDAVVEAGSDVAAHQAQSLRGVLVFEVALLLRRLLLLLDKSARGKKKHAKLVGL